MASGQLEWLRRNPVDGSLLVLVPEGRFLAGGTEHFESSCAPFFTDLPAFYLAIHPVTQLQYARFIRETQHSPPRCVRGKTAGELLWPKGSPAEEELDHPVTGVSWEDAQSYCDWAGGRLPSELEWEKAARGTDGRLFPWGNEWDPGRCRNDRTRHRQMTTAVWDHAEHSSVWGHYQLSGNVWEWCADWYSPSAYKRYQNGDLEPPGSGHERVVRGGSWFNVHPESFRATYRFRLPPSDAERQYGFRLAAG